MAALWCDGFDHYGPAGNEAKLLDAVYAQATGVAIANTPVNTVQSAPGVTSHSLGITATSALRRSLGGDFTTVGLMTPIYMAALPIVPCGGLGAGGAFVLQSFRNLANKAHINIQIGTTGRIEVWGGGLDGSTAPGLFLLVRSTKEMAPGTFNHVETKVKIDAAAGTVEVRVNGKVFCTYAGNTARASAGTADVSQVFMGLSDGSTPPTFLNTWWTDDWAAWNDENTDAQGHAALITDFIGQYGVYTLPPIADSTPEDWNLSTGVDSYALVDEIPPNDNTDFLFSGLVGDKTALQPAALPVTITDIAFVMPVIRSRKTDNGSCDVTIGVISGGTEEEDAGGGDAQTTTFQYYGHPWEADPDTGVAWTPTVLPDIQIDRTL